MSIYTVFGIICIGLACAAIYFSETERPQIARKFNALAIGILFGMIVTILLEIHIYR